MLNGNGEGSDEKDDDPNEIYNGEHDEGIVFAKVLVGHDPTQDACNVAPELSVVRREGWNGYKGRALYLKKIAEASGTRLTKTWTTISSGSRIRTKRHTYSTRNAT